MTMPPDARAPDRRLHVLFITAWYPTAAAPYEGTFVREHALAVARFDDVAVLHCPEPRRDLPRLWQVETETDPVLTAGLPTVRAWYRPAPIPKVSLGVHLVAVGQALRAVYRAGFRPDLLHAHVYDAGFAAAIFSKLYRLPLVVTEHFSAFPRHTLPPGEVRKARIAFGQAARVLPVSRALQTGIEEHGLRARFQIVGNVVDNTLFYPAPARTPNDPLRIVSVGSLVPIKGIPDLLHALRRLQETPLRWRLAPLGMDTYWVQTTVDLDYHVVGVRLQEPGGEKELLTYLKRIMGVHLDRTRPMWRLYVIEGMQDGQYAYLFKVHHGLADGSARWTILDHLADHPTTGPEVSDTEPDGPFEILAGGMQDYLDKPLKAVALQANIGKWLAERVAEEQAGAIPAMLARLIPGELALPFVAVANAIRAEGVPEIVSQRPVLMPPPSPFNGTTTRNVEIALVDFALDDLRRAGKAAGGTINDAVLAVTAGALRAYMAEHGGMRAPPPLCSWGARSVPA